MTHVKKLYILLCGYETIRKSGCVRGDPRHIVLAVPISCYLLDTDNGWVMFDTGLHSAQLEDPVAANAAFRNDVFPAPPIVLPEHEVLPQLGAVGVAPEDVTTIILSHAHGDHTGHLTAFPNAEIVIQKSEHEFAFSDAGRAQRNFSEFAEPSLRWRIVDGDVTLMPGLELLLTRGHRPGHQSAVVTLPSGDVKILVGDAADLLENFEREVIGGATHPEDALISLRRLKKLAVDTGAELVPLHDPYFIQRAKLLPEFYA